MKQYNRVTSFLFLVIFCFFFTSSFSQSISLATDRARLKIVSIPDIKGGGDLKVIRTDADTPLRGAAPIIEKKQVQLAAIRENFIKDQSDAGMNSIRLIWFEAWQKAAGYDAFTDFNNPTEVTHCLQMLETYVNLCSQYGMYCIINFHSAFQKPYDEAYATQMWKVVGAYFKNRTHVAFETANEPSEDFNAWIQNAEIQKHANIYNVVKGVAPNTMQFVLTPNRLPDSYPTALNIADKLSSITTIDWSNTAVGYHLYGGSLDEIRNLHKAYPALPTENNFPQGSGADKDPWGGVSLDGDYYTSQTCEKLGIGWLHWAITNDCNCYEGWYSNWPLMLADAKSKGWYWNKDSAKEFDTTIPYSNQAPKIDGNKEISWPTAVNVISNLTVGSVANSADLSATWSAIWDNANLYIFVNVKDEKIQTESGASWWEDDRIELFIDAGFTRTTIYGAKQYQYYVKPNETSLKEVKLNATSNTLVAYKALADGYNFEIKIPFATLGITPTSDSKVGIDIQIGDDDGVAAYSKISWRATNDNSWQNPSLFGVAKLVTNPTGLNDEVIFQNFTLFPNPGSDKIKISNLKPGSLLTVINANGSLMVIQEVNKPELEVNINNWNKGLYFIKIQEDNKIVTKKFIVN